MATCISQDAKMDRYSTANSQESLNDDSQFPPFRFLVIRRNAVFGGSAALIGLGDRDLSIIVLSTPGSCLVPKKMELRWPLGGDEGFLKRRFGVAKGNSHQWESSTNLRRTHTQFILGLVRILTLLAIDIHDRRNSLLFLCTTIILTLTLSPLFL